MVIFESVLSCALFGGLSSVDGAIDASVWNCPNNSTNFYDYFHFDTFLFSAVSSILLEPFSTIVAKSWPQNCYVLCNVLECRCMYACERLVDCLPRFLIFLLLPFAHNRLPLFVLCRIIWQKIWSKRFKTIIFAFQAHSRTHFRTYT